MDLGLEIQKTNVEIGISTSSRYHVRQFSGKTNNSDFFGPNLPKNGFLGRNFKNVRTDSESAPPPPKDTMCANFQSKRTTLNFSA